MITIDVEKLYTELVPNDEGTAKLSDVNDYIARARELAGVGQNVVLTGRGPIWLYLAVSHALHGQVKTLYYSSPVTGRLTIYNHNPFR